MNLTSDHLLVMISQSRCSAFCNVLSSNINKIYNVEKFLLKSYKKNAKNFYVSLNIVSNFHCGKILRFNASE